MRTVPIALLGGLAVAALWTPSDAGGDSSVGKMFQARCAACHSVPDPELRTDRAWLDQVNRTA